MFTGMLKIVITLVRAEIFNLDGFFKSLYASCGKERSRQKETDSGSRERGVTAFG